MTKPKSPRYRRIVRLVAALLAVLVLAGCAGVGVTQYYEAGALATVAPIATDIGAQLFAHGANSFDVAVAVGFALAVVHPEAGNIGGGGFAIIRDGKSGEVRALDFRETAPSAAHEQMFLDSTGNVIPGLSTLGPVASGVPGTVAGLYELWQAYGSMPWEELVGIAADLADSGFYVDQYLAESFDDNRNDLTVYDETARVFFPGDRPLREGDRWVQPDLARALYMIAAEGKDPFYKGAIADSIVATMGKYGGLITREDLENYAVIWREPLRFTFDSFVVYSMPPPSSGGIALQQILTLLEPFSLSLLGPESPRYIHLFTEASRLAYADRSEYLGDPAFYTIPQERLLNKAYLDHRRELIDSLHASSSEDVRPGIVTESESEQTTHFSVCDRDGNVVSLTYTINTAYGSKLVVGGYGFLLNNEMDDFSVKPGVPNVYGLIGGEANKVEPAKRMLSSMCPTILFKDGEPRLVLGSPGGSKIITTVAQAIINIARFDLSAEQVVGRGRFHHQWIPDILYLEEGKFDINTKQDLIRYGHMIEERSQYGDLQILQINAGGLITGASDPRNRGLFGGF